MFLDIKMQNNKVINVREFEKITNPTESYFIGYLFGDGNFNSGKKENRTDRMGVTSVDEYIIQGMIKYFQPNLKYRSLIPVNNTRNIVSKIYSHRIDFSSYFKDVFEFHGILSTKPNRKYKNIPYEYMKHFILGFLDADGSITCFMGDDGKGGLRFRTGITFTHPSRDSLTDVANFIKNELNVDSSLQYKKGENCSVLKISGNNDCLKLSDWLYSDIENLEFYNIRKFEKYLELKDMFFKQRNNPLCKVKGIRKCGKKYSPFIILNEKCVYLGNCFSYDEAVTKRLTSEAVNIKNIAKNSQCNFNPLTNTVQLNYISLDDGKRTFIEIGLDGEVLNLNKYNL